MGRIAVPPIILAYADDRFGPRSRIVSCHLQRDSDAGGPGVDSVTMSFVADDGTTISDTATATVSIDLG